MDSGCLLEARDSEGDTPLHVASANSELHTVKDILNNDDVIDVNARNPLTGATPLHKVGYDLVENLSKIA